MAHRSSGQMAVEYGSRGLQAILKENLAAQKKHGSVSAVDPRIAGIWLCNYRYFEQRGEDFVKQLLP